MNIKVTQDDIDNGRACNSRACPIALTAKRALKNITHGEEVRVSLETMHFLDKQVDLPREAQLFIENFDEAGSRTACKPFEFFIEL
jgi:hypothetical protein